MPLTRTSHSSKFAANTRFRSYFRDSLVVDHIHQKVGYFYSTVEVIMANLAKRIEREHPMAERTVLEERVDYIQRDVAELKVDVKRIDATLTEMKESMGELRAEMKEAIGDLRVDMKDSLLAIHLKLSEFHHSHIKWTVGTLIAAVGMAFMVAKFFS